MRTLSAVAWASPRDLARESKQTPPQPTSTSTLIQSLTSLILRKRVAYLLDEASSVPPSVGHARKHHVAHSPPLGSTGECDALPGMCQDAKCKQKRPILTMLRTAAQDYSKASFPHRNRNRRCWLGSGSIVPAAALAHYSVCLHHRASLD